MWNTKFAGTLMLSLFLLGCAQMTKQEAGTLTGAGVGALVGSQFGRGDGRIIATAAGAILGGFLGGQIGKSMDDTDRLKMSRSLENTRTGSSYSWRNPDSGANYQVTPTKTYYRNDRPCREFTTNATIDGRKERVYGKACRMSDGSWKMV